MGALPLEERYLEGYRETCANKAGADLFTEKTAEAAEVDQDLARVLEAHRRHLDVGLVQHLPRLCFSVQGAEDHRGKRYVLWRPVVEFIQDEFEFEIEDWLCRREVAIVYLSHEAARFVEGLYSRVENARVNNPYRSERSTFAIALNPLLDLTLAFREERTRRQKSQIGFIAGSTTGFGVPVWHPTQERNWPDWLPARPNGRSRLA